MSLVAKALDLLEQYIRRDPNPAYIANAMRCVDAAREEHAALVPAADVPTPEERAAADAALTWLQSTPDTLGKNEGMMVLALRRLEARRAAKEKTNG